MFAICIESSHQRGMGHLFRAINLIRFLKKENEKFILFINKDFKSNNILEDEGILYETVNLEDTETDWESDFIRKYQIKTWINDRLNTVLKHSENVKKNQINLITFDDKGDGANLADINFCGMEFETNIIKGKKVFCGVNYLILNKEIDLYKRVRNTSKPQIIVTLGGSDTYGVTLKVIKILKSINKFATVIIGPAFAHKAELKSISDKNFLIKESVPSLIKEFYEYDLAITGGGVTAFEANASGLPSIIIANEPHEVKYAKFLEKIGSSVFAGYYKEINKEIFYKELDLAKMSMIGLDSLSTCGTENIFNEIVKI